MPSLDTLGFAYVPLYCEGSGDCKVHFVLHGCNMNLEGIGFDFIKYNQINELAEANKFVVVYPMVKLIESPKFDNKACWDFFGYTNRGSDLASAYMTKTAPHIQYLYDLYQSFVQGTLELLPTHIDSP